MDWNYKKILSEPKIRFISLGIFSGLATGLIYPGNLLSHKFTEGFIFVALIPLFYSLFSEQNKWKFLTGFLAGLIYFLIVFRWFWGAFPLTALGVDNGLVSFLLILFIYLISSSAMALSWGLLGIISSKLNFGKFGILVLPAIFSIFQFLNSLLWGLVWFGPGSFIGPHWTMGNLAYILNDSQIVLWLSSYVGIYGLTFLIILINLFILKYFYIVKNKKILLLIIVFIVLVLSVVSLPKTVRDGDKKINYTLVQTNQSTQNSSTPKGILDDFKKQIELLNMAAKINPATQIVIFPESTDLFKNLSKFMTSAQIKKYFTGLFPEPTLIISGAKIVEQNGKYYSRIFYLDSQNDIIGYRDKAILAPGGEFLPYLLKWPLKILYPKSVLYFDDLRELTRGEKIVNSINFRDKFKTAAVACSEILSPSFMSSIHNPDFFIDMASYGIFNGNDILAKQNLAAAKFRAAENKKPILLASNMGLSFAINSSGIISNQTKTKDPQILTGDLVFGPTKSWYNKLGDWPVLLLCLLIIFGQILLKKLRR